MNCIYNLLLKVLQARIEKVKLKVEFRPPRVYCYKSKQKYCTVSNVYYF